METLFSISSRSLRDRTLDAPERTRPHLGTRQIVFRLDITALAATPQGPNPELRLTISWTMPDGVTGTNSGVFRHVGRHEIGFWRSCAQAGNVRVSGVLEAVGNITFSGAVLAVDQGEDVPE